MQISGGWMCVAFVLSGSMEIGGTYWWPNVAPPRSCSPASLPPSTRSLQGDPRDFQTWLDSRPRRFEKNAVRALMEALRVSEARRPAPGFNLHIVHLADADLLPELKRAKMEGLPLSVETCPHYLNFAAEDVLMGDTRWVGQGGVGMQMVAF